MNNLLIQTSKTTNQFHPACTFDLDGRLIVSNLSAFWLPELTTRERIHGTTYIIDGSYDSTDPLIRKLERIIIRNLSGDVPDGANGMEQEEPEMLQESEEKADDRNDE